MSASRNTIVVSATWSHLKCTEVDLHPMSVPYPPLLQK